MRRRSAWLGMGVLVFAGVVNAAGARTRLAPADEYFGPMKMSPLEITNRIADAERGRGQSYRGLMNTQAAIEDWTAKYPADPWIVPRENRIARLFSQLRSRDGDREAAHCRAFLNAHFRNGIRH